MIKSIENIKKWMGVLPLQGESRTFALQGKVTIIPFCLNHDLLD